MCSTTLESHLHHGSTSCHLRAVLCLRSSSLVECVLHIRVLSVGWFEVSQPKFLAYRSICFEQKSLTSICWKKSGFDPKLLRHFGFLGVGRWFCEETDWSFSAVSLTLNSEITLMSKQCLAKVEWYFNKWCSSLDSSPGLSIDWIQLNFDKNCFRCFSVFVGFNCSLPPRAMISSFMRLFFLLRLVGSSHVSGVGYNRLISVSVCTWNNWLTMCSPSFGRLFKSSTCTCFFWLRDRFPLHHHQLEVSNCY